MNSAPYTAINIANYLIKKSKAEKNRLHKLNHLKLQKILYYAQGWYLANRNKTLFIDPIKAWALGPAIRSVYDRYKYYGSDYINQDIGDEEISMIHETDKKFLDSLWNKYKKYSATELVFSTHTEPPWYKTRNGLKDGEKSDAEIPVGLIDSYFKQRLQNVAG